MKHKAELLNISSELFCKKWRLAILFALKSGPVRYGQLKKLHPELSTKVLTDNLKDLEKAGLVIRKVCARRIPVVVTYELAPMVQPFADTMDILYMVTVDLFKANRDLMPLPEELDRYLDTYK